MFEGLNFGSAGDKIFDSLNQLFESENIELKTRLSKNQIKALCYHHFCLQILSGVKAIDAQVSTLEYYKNLLVSLNSMSREEFLKGFSGARTFVERTGLLKEPDQEE